MKIQNRNIVIFAPHQDDETIGCGGIIQKLSPANNVHIAVAARVTAFQSYHPVCGQYVPYKGTDRDKEFLRALQILNVKETHVHYLFAPEYHNRLDGIQKADLITGLENMIQNAKADCIFIPARSTNQDHQILHDCLLSAARPHFYHGAILEYEVEYEEDFRPNYYVSLTKDEAETKLNALMCFETQMKSGFAKISRNALRARMEYRGSDVCSAYAEAFRLIRYCESYKV